MEHKLRHRRAEIKARRSLNGAAPWRSTPELQGAKERNTGRGRTSTARGYAPGHRREGRHRRREAVVRRGCCRHRRLPDSMGNRIAGQRRKEARLNKSLGRVAAQEEPIEATCIPEPVSPPERQRSGAYFSFPRRCDRFRSRCLHRNLHSKREAGRVGAELAISSGSEEEDEARQDR